MFRVFYSWQSDLEPKVTRSFIKTSLEKAQTALRKKNYDFELQESARGVPGSPDIATVILERIKGADAAVFDVSIITPPDAARPAPNPNVLIELGYAAGVIGWGRVLMVFNEAFGGKLAQPAVPKEAFPFDLGLKQVIPYKLAQADDTEKLDIREHLAACLASRLVSVFSQAERLKEFEPLLKFIIRAGLAQIDRGNASAVQFFQQLHDEGNEHAINASQDEIADFNGNVSRPETNKLLNEMDGAGLIAPDKTNLGHKTWFVTNKGFAVAKDRGLFNDL
jgi:hypothetical protein